MIQGTACPRAYLALMVVNLVFGDVSALFQGSFPSLYEGLLTFDFYCTSLIDRDTTCLE